MSGFRLRALGVCAVFMFGALSVAGCTPEVAATSTDPGAAIVERRCTICHTADRINSAKKDADGWNATIDRMRGKGAVVSEQEQQQLVTYLTSK